MEKLRVSTKTSLFKPIELELETDKGVKVYKLGMFTTEIVEQLEKSGEVIEDRMPMLREQLKMMFGVPIAVSKKLDIRDVDEIFTWLGKQVFSREKRENGKEKNVSRVEQTQSKP